MRFHVAQILPRIGGLGFYSTAGHVIRRLRARTGARYSPLAWLRFPTRLSSAAKQQRSNVSFEGVNPRHSRLCAKLLVWRRLVLFRRAALFPRSLEWRQFRSLLDLHADRANVELRMSARALASARHADRRAARISKGEPGPDGSAH